MHNISLYIPNIEDYWYEEKLLSDTLTMEYNAGYDVSYDGYHYDTGCIDFPSNKWKDKYDKRVKNNMFFAYIKDNDINEYIGYVNYQKNNDRYYCGIVIESKYRGECYSKEALKLLCEGAKENGIKELYDCFEIDRVDSINLFKSLGFEIVEETIGNKFNKEVKSVVVRKIL